MKKSNRSFGKWGAYKDVHVTLPIWLIREIKKRGVSLSKFLERAAVFWLEHEQGFLKEFLVVPRPGFEPGTCGSTVRRRSQARLPRDPTAQPFVM